MTLPDRYRAVWVQVCDGVADDVRLVAAHVSKSPVPPALEDPIHSLFALLGEISLAQIKRDEQDERTPIR